jgi:hypothetical protein
VISRRTRTGRRRPYACALQAALFLLSKANICRRPRIALSEIAEPGVRAQIGHGLLTDPEGLPVGIDVFKGNTADAIAFKNPAGKVRKDFGLKDHLVPEASGRGLDALDGAFATARAKAKKPDDPGAPDQDVGPESAPRPPSHRAAAGQGHDEGASRPVGRVLPATFR